jgi:dTDP-4-dehydrorhamnose reductase
MLQTETRVAKPAGILITGGSGFLGGHLVLASSGWDPLIATFHLNAPAARPGLCWEPLDLNVPGRAGDLVRSARPAVVIHAAAMSRPDECETDQAAAERVNFRSAEEIAAACSEIGARLIFISSDLVFDGAHAPYREGDPTCPVSVYGRTKRDAEEAVLSCAPDAAVVRPALIYGAPAIGGTSFSENLRRAWAAGRPTPLFVDQFRTMIEAGALARAVLELAEIGFRGILHVAGTERISRIGFGRRLAPRLGADAGLIRPVTMAEVHAAARRPADVSLDVTLARGILKTPLPDIAAGLSLAYGPGRD